MKDLTQGNISKNLWGIALPVLIAELLSYILTTIDQVMLGKIVGDVGLAAVGATSSYFGILWGLYGALSSGFGAHLACLVGKGDGTAMKRAVKVNTRVNVLIGVVTVAASWALWRPLFSFLNVPSDVFEEAKRYYLVYAFAFFFFILKGNFAAALLSFGSSSFQMRVSIGGAVCNVVLNYVTIVPLKMGAMGAAVATLAVSMGTTLLYMFRFYRELGKLEGESDRVRMREYAPILHLVLPTFFQQMMMYVFAFIAQPSINTLGKTAIAALSVGISICEIITLCYKQFSRGMSVFVGQALGHGKPSLIRRGFRITVRDVLMLALPFITLLLLFPRVAPLVFLEDPYGETASFLIGYVYCCIPFSLSLAFNNMLHNFFRGVLRPGLNIAGGLAMGVVRAGLTIALIPVLGIYGAFIGYSAGWTADFLVMLGIYLSKKWKTPSYLEAERAERESAEALAAQ